MCVCVFVINFPPLQLIQPCINLFLTFFFFFFYLIWKSQGLYYKTFYYSNEGKSAVSFCYLVAACVSDLFCNFYFVKNHKIVSNSATANTRENVSTDWTPQNFGIILLYVWLNLEAIIIYLIKFAADFCWQPSYLLGERSAFVPKSFHQKITNPNCKRIKGSQRTLEWKSCL